MEPLLDSAPFGFAVLRDDGYVEAANATLAEILAMPRDKLVGRHVDGLLSAPSRIFYQTHVFPTLKLQGRVDEVYLALMTAGGAELPVLLNARRRDTPEGPRSDWALMPMKQRNEYENEILKARRRAEESAVAKDRFLSFVSHELRSPLSAIKGWAEILAKKSGDPATVKRGLEAIQRNATLQVKLVDDMLDHARLTSGKLRVELKPVDARAAMESALEGVEPAANARGVAIERDLTEEALRVSGDAERLLQVFWNVLSNAVKFTPDGGLVRAAMHRADGWIEAVVADTGKGIDPDFLPFVFESFRQEEGRLVRAEGGLGLGMSITRHLVELHGGSISAASEGPGKGSTFTVRLPALGATATPANGISATTRSPT